MTELKKDHFVLFEGKLCTINIIKDGVATLCDGHIIVCDKLGPVEIGGPLDNEFTLVNDLLRYPSGEIITEPIKSYKDCYVSQEMTINDVLKDYPSIKFIHELQDWLLANKEELRIIRKHSAFT